VLRFRENTVDGARRERVVPIGSVHDFPKERDARREVDRRGLLAEVNAEEQTGRIRFDALAEFYLKADFGADAMRPKADKTTSNTQHIVRSYLIPRFGNEIADDIKPLEVQRWLKSLNTALAWPTISKIRGIMLRIYKVGLLHERVTKNPIISVETRSETDYKPILLTPENTLAILGVLSSDLHRIVVLTCAATALRSSELLALGWADIRFDEGKIRVCKRWAQGKDGATKTQASDGTFPMHPTLAEQLRDWHATTPYGESTDFVFPSLREGGRVPLSPAVFVADHLRTAAIKVGVPIKPSQRFGFHNLRHSLSNWMVNKGNVSPKTVQVILRHSRIQTTLDLYTQEDRDETQAAQGAYLKAMGMTTDTVQ
jgi:integrase